MKNRNIPFGYCYENGKIIIYPEEQQILFRIRDEYLGGSSLLQIAQGLTADAVEYAFGGSAWNKNKILRIVEDDRYLGTDCFPPIFDAQTVQRLRARKNANSTQREVDRSGGIYRLHIPVRCNVCGTELRRVQNRKCRCPQWWECSVCRTKIKIADEAFTAQITKLLNRLAEKPDEIRRSESDEVQIGAEEQRIEREIRLAFDRSDFGGDALPEKLFRRFSLHYAALPEDGYIAEKLNALMKEHEPSYAFSPELTNRAVQEIHLSVDRNVSLTLINGQSIGKG